MDISVVIINYNAANFLRGNINSLINQTVKFKEIIIIDNNSSDDSKKIINQFQGIKKILLNQNTGYARGANIGISECRSDLILIANTDIILDEHFNRNVIKKFESDKKISMLSPKILRFDRETIDSAGQAPSLALYPSEIGYGKKKNKRLESERKIFSVCGAATVFRTEDLERLKIDNEYYDEDFFIFWEDFDIGWRASLLGMKVFYFPDAVVYHYRSATMKRNLFTRFSLSLGRSSSIKYHLIKNRYLCLIKNFRFKQFWWSIPFIILKDLVWVTMLTLSSPKIIINLFKSGEQVRRALRKRKIIKNHE